MDKELQDEILRGRGLDPSKHSVSDDGEIIENGGAVEKKSDSSSAMGVVARKFRDNTGSVLGAIGTTAAVASLFTPGAPLGIGALTALGTAGLGGSVLGGMGQRKLNKVVGGDYIQSSDEQSEKDKQEHPIASTIGTVAPMFIGGKPSIRNAKDLASGLRTLTGTGAAATAGRSVLNEAEKHALKSAAVNVGLTGGMEGVNKLRGGDIDAQDTLAGLAASTLVGPRWGSKSPQVQARKLMGTDTSKIKNTPVDILQSELSPHEKTKLNISETTAERPEAVDIQVSLAKDASSPKRAVFIPKSGKELSTEQQVGLIPFKKPTGTLYVNESKYSPDELVAVKASKHINGKDLGYSTDHMPDLLAASEVGTKVVTTSIAGVPDVLSEVVLNTPEAIKTATDHHKMVLPDGVTEVKEAGEILAHRGTVVDTKQDKLNLEAGKGIERDLAKKIPAIEQESQGVQDEVHKSQQKEDDAVQADIESGKTEVPYTHQYREGDLFDPNPKTPAELMRLRKIRREDFSNQLDTADTDKWNKQSGNRSKQEQLELAAERKMANAKWQAEEDARLKEEQRLSEVEPKPGEEPLSTSTLPIDPVGENYDFGLTPSQRRARLLARKEGETQTVFNPNNPNYSKPEESKTKRGTKNVKGHESQMVEGYKKYDADGNEIPFSEHALSNAPRKPVVSDLDIPSEPDYQTSIPREGNPNVRRRLTLHAGETGHQVQVSPQDTFTTEGDLTLRYGKQSPIEGSDRSNIELNSKFAETPAHELMHAALESDPEFRDLFHKAVHQRAFELGLSPDEYIAEENIATRSGKQLLDRIENNDFGFWKDLVNTAKYHLGNQSPEVLGRILENRVMYDYSRPGGTVTHLGNNGYGDMTTGYLQPAFGSAMNSITDPKARKSIEDAFNEKTVLKGKLSNDIVNKLQQFPFSSVKSAVDKIRPYYRQGETTPLTVDELPIVKVITDHNMMVAKEHADSGYERDIHASPYYIPEALSHEAKLAINNPDGINDPKVKDIIQSIGDYWHTQGMDNANTEARDYILGVSGAKGGNLAIEGFDPLHKAAGWGLPEKSTGGIPIYESNPLRIFSRYGDAAATDMAWKRNVMNKLTPQEVMNVESTPAWQAVRDNYFGGDNPNNPKTRAVAGLAGAAALGPITKAMNAIQAGPTAMLLGSRPSDIAGAIKNMATDLVGSTSRAIKGGIVKPAIQKEIALNAAERITKAADYLGQYTGANFLDKFARVGAHELAHVTATRMKAEGNEKWFSERGVDIQDYNAVDRAATQMAEMIHGRRDARELPNVMLKGAFADIAPIHRWSVGHAGNLVTEMQNGNYANFLYYLAGGVGVGLARKELNELITGRKSAAPTLKELDASGKGLGSVEGAGYVADLLRAAGVGGVITDITDAGLSAYQGKKAQIIYNPLASSIQSGVIEALPHWIQAINAGIPWHEAAGLIAENVFKNTVQVWRVGEELAKSPEESARLSDRRDFGTYKRLTGDQSPYTGDYNPAIMDKTRAFQGAENPDEVDKAFAELQPILAKKKNKISVPGDPYMPSKPMDKQSYMEYEEKASDPNLNRKLDRSVNLRGVKGYKRSLVKGVLRDDD